MRGADAIKIHGLAGFGGKRVVRWMVWTDGE